MFLHYAGSRYWSASLLPALVGATLPFWLHPPGFSFRWLGAVEFLLATIICHAGFSFLKASFEAGTTAEWGRSRLLKYAALGIGAACFLGLHINSGLSLNESVYKQIFIVYGIATLLVGVIYVLPPINLYRRVGGEVVIAEGLGMMPVLGAYLVQAGDLTRTVYLASLPIVVATGLWVWIDELVSRPEDVNSGRRTMVIDFGLNFSGRTAVLALVVALYAAITLAVLSASLSPLALIALLSIGLALKILVVSWRAYASPERMIPVRKTAIWLHLAICSILAASSLASSL